MTVDGLSQSLKNGELSGAVVIRPEIIELNSSSLLDEAVLEDTKSALSVHSGSYLLNNPQDLFYPLVKHYQDVVYHNLPSVLPPYGGVRHEIDFLLGPNIVSHDSGPCQRSSVMSLMNSSMPTTRRKFLLESRTVSGVLCMLISSLTRSLFRHRHPTIPRKDVLRKTMVYFTMYSALDFVDGYH